MSAEVKPFKPYRRAGNNRTKSQIEAECLEVLKMKRLGHLNSQIAETLGMSLMTVHNRRKQALEMFGESTVAEYRKEIGQQYDMLLQATMDGVARKDEKMIARALNILQAKARLTGADQPQAVDLAITVETEQEKGIAASIARAQADAAAAEEAIIDAEVVEEG